MDLDYFRRRQQVSDLMSHNAACDCSRIVHRQMANAYASLVNNAEIAGTGRAALLSTAA